MICGVKSNFEAIFYITTISILTYAVIHIAIIVEGSCQKCEASYDLMQMIDGGERYMLYDVVRNRTVQMDTQLNGVYNYNSDIFCIYGKSPKEMNETVCHEYCHYLIDEGMCFNNSGEDITCKEHFC